MDQFQPTGVVSRSFASVSVSGPSGFQQGHTAAPTKHSFRDTRVYGGYDGSGQESFEWGGGLLVVPVWQPEAKSSEGPEAAERWAQLPEELDGKLGGALSVVKQVIADREFKGALGTHTTAHLGGAKGGFSNAMLLGMGRRSALTQEGLLAIAQKAAAAVAGFAKTETVGGMGVLLPNNPQAAEGGAQQSGAVAFDSRFVEQFLTELFSRQWVDNRYRTGDRVQRERPIQFVSFLAQQSNPALQTDSLARSEHVSKAVAAGNHLARDLVSAPPNACTPQAMAETAANLAREYGLTARIYEETEIRDMNMGAYLGVAQGSVHPPRFIHLTYTPKPSADSTAPLRRLAYIGKGITFDSGGYNIKVQNMHLMKNDMAGGAAVLGAARTISELQPPGVEVHFIVAACENMISHNAYRPSDVLVSASGKTIEIENTDAEGRLALADALWYAENKIEPKVERIVELSTLTGAVMVALGPHMAGYWTSNDALAQDLERCSKSTLEGVWRMPLVQSYKDMLKSKVADFKNVGTAQGGAITAALFLNEFVEKTPYVHIDMAGPAWDDKEAQGATGWGVGLLTKLAVGQGAAQESVRGMGGNTAAEASADNLDQLVGRSFAC